MGSDRSRLEIAINPVESGHAGVLALGSGNFGIIMAADLGEGAEETG